MLLISSGAGIPAQPASKNAAAATAVHVKRKRGSAQFMVIAPVQDLKFAAL
jgi:hypothetical protein